MSGDLRVATAKLRELAADTSVRVTHGVIAWSTAGLGMKGVAEEMADKLGTSARVQVR